MQNFETYLCRRVNPDRGGFNVLGVNHVVGVGGSRSYREIAGANPDDAAAPWDEATRDVSAAFPGGEGRQCRLTDRGRFPANV